MKKKHAGVVPTILGFGLMLGVLWGESVLAGTGSNDGRAPRAADPADLRLADSAPLIVKTAGADDNAAAEATDDHADGEKADDGPGLDNDHGGDKGDGDGESNDDGN